MTLQILLCLFLSQLVYISAETLVVLPDKLNLPEGSTRSLDFRFINCSDSKTDAARNVSISLVKGWERNLDYPHSMYNVPCRESDNGSFGSNATVSAKMIGFVTLAVTDQRSGELYREYSLGITRPPERIQDKVYLYGLMIFIVLVTLMFGLDLDLGKVKSYMRRPTAPAIGMACQYILMPLIGYIMTLCMTTHRAEKLGIFASATSPGGGLSNILAFVLGGDVDLSITMTFISTLVALAVIPAWMYTLGQHIIGDYDITLPFANMAMTLALLIVPLTVGIVINRFLPKVAKVLLYLKKLSILLIILFAVAMSIWVNLYAFKLVLLDYQLALCTGLLPYTGGLLAFLIALLCRLDRKLAITIGIETAIQNNNISIILLKTSLPQPWADISSAIPISMIIFTFAPFPFMLLAQQIYIRVKRRKELEKQAEEELKMNDKLGVDNPAIITDEQA